MFTDENAACVVLDDNMYFMVLTREYLGTFSDKQIIDPKTQAQMCIAFTRDSRESVDAMLDKGLAAGGTEPRARKTSDSCTRATSKTPTATSSASSSWSPPRPRWAPRPTWPSREPRRLRLRPDRAGNMATRAARGFGQYSGAARALERVGDRWALLIVRDLLVGARRYGDLKAGLPRIPTNILSDRLKELQESGVIRRVPTVRGGYELTTFGRALEPVVVALERWGWSALGEPAEGEIVTADALAVALRAAFRPDVAAGAPPTEYVLHVGALRVRSVRRLRARRLQRRVRGWASADDASPGTRHRAGAVSVVAVVANATLEVTPIGPGALPQPRRGDAAEVAFEASAELVLSAAEFRDLISGALEPAAVQLLAGEQEAVVRFARTFHIAPVGPAPDAASGSNVARASVA